MYKTEQRACPNAQAALAEFSSNHVAIAATLDGTINGDIWVDDKHKPKAAVVVNGDAYYLAGHHNKSAQTLEKLREFIPDWAYLFAEGHWVPYLDQAWGNPFVLRHPRLRMGNRPSVALPTFPPPPSDFEVIPVDRELFDRMPGNLDTLQNAVEEWISEEKFFDTAVGFCVFHGGKVVSHSLTDCVVGNRCEVGVRTVPEFRRQGLGTIAASATLNECLRRGLTDIEWHTHASNKGSIAIATSIGLVERDRYIAHSCRLPAENIGDLDHDQCRELATHFERASKHINWCRFPAAGARALAGDRKGALENIRLLIESDWQGETSWLEDFWALQTLKGDADFHALIS